MRSIALVFLSCAGGGPASGAAPPPPALAGGGRVVVYTPRGWAPDASWRPSAAGLRADAGALVRLGTVAAVTERTTAALRPACRFLKRHGVDTVIVGVADPGDAAELRAARALRRCADGYAVGSGGLAAGHYRRRQLDAAVAMLRRASARPVAVRERVASYEADPGLLQAGDWVFPLVEADPRRGAQEACGATMADYQRLRARVPAGRVVVLAAGLPTAGAPGAGEHAQRAYFACLASRGIPFAHDEGFDQPWRGGADASRGLFRAGGSPKLYARQLVEPRRPPR